MFKISLIPLPYKILIGVGLLIVAFSGGVWQGSFSTDKSWQLKDTERIAADGKAKLEAVALKEKQAREQAARVVAVDEKYQKELGNAQTEIETLRRAVRVGSVRLYAKSAKPAAISGLSTTPASGIDAQARCELDPTTADDLISITADGDAAIRQLTALQDYVLNLKGFE